MTPHLAKVLRFPPPSITRHGPAMGKVWSMDEHPCEIVAGVAVDYATRRAIRLATILGAVFWALLIGWFAA